MGRATRGVWAGLAVAGSAWACSSPGTTVIVEQAAPPTDGGAVLDSGAIGSSADAGAGVDADAGKADAGAADAGPTVNAFTFAPAYFAGVSPAAAKGQNGHLFANKDPSGLNCMTSSCHGVGGPGVVFGFAGTVYLAAGTPGPASVEVRVTDAMGAKIDSVYTDADGNFWSLVASSSVPADALTGVRVGKTVRVMSATAPASCNAATCHVSSLNPMLQ